MIQWSRFNAIGILGAAVQLATLSLLMKIGVHYLVATALAVEAAVLHNHAWHRRWTWAGRAAPGSLWRFHLANGLVSIVSNVVLMRLFAGHFGWPAAPANLLAIVLTSCANFALADRWVFPLGVPAASPRGGTEQPDVTWQPAESPLASAAKIRGAGW